MSELIVTTAVKVKEESIVLAESLSQKWQVPYIKRNKLTLQQLLNTYGNTFLIYANRLEYVHVDGTRLFFHPNTAVIRIKNGHDPLMALVGSGNDILDCTMGLAGDSIVMAYGGNRIVALEHDPIIFEIVSHGLKHFSDVDLPIQEAMQRISFVQADYTNYLASLPDNSVDIIYFDPMFSHVISESTNINGIKTRQEVSALSAEVILHAKRVCRKKVIIKAHFRDDVFERLGLERLVRPYTKFHYGVWTKTITVQ